MGRCVRCGVLSLSAEGYVFSFAYTSFPLPLQVLKPGASVNTIEVRLYDEASGKLVAQGTHVKVCNLWICGESKGKVSGNGMISLAQRISR